MLSLAQQFRINNCVIGDTGYGGHQIAAEVLSCGPGYLGQPERPDGPAGRH